MSNNATLNQTLAEIEQNLRKLESARSQVNRLSEKNEETIRLFSNLISSLEAIKINYHNEDVALKKTFKDQRKHFEIEFERVVTNVNQTYEKHINPQVAAIKEAKNELDKFNASLNQLKHSIESLDIEKELSKVTESLSNMMAEFDSALKSHANTIATVIEKQQESIKQLNDAISINNSTLSNLQIQIKENQIDITANLNGLSRFLEKNRHDLKLLKEDYLEKLLKQASSQIDSIAVVQQSIETFDENFRSNFQDLHTTIHSQITAIENVVSGLNATLKQTESELFKKIDKLEKAQKTTTYIMIGGIISIIAILLFTS